MHSSDSFERDFDESTGKTIDADTCPECGGRLCTESGEVACGDCGLIVEEYCIDHGFETYFGDEERTDAPVTPSRHDQGLSTEIGFGPDANGNLISGQKRRQLGRLSRKHNRARFDAKKERNLAMGCAEIARVTTALGLSRSVRDRASMFFRRAHEQDLLQGRSIEGMAAASVYAVCRCDGYPRTIEDVVAVAQCERSGVVNAYGVLNTEIGLPAKPRRPSAFLPRLASEVYVPDRVRLRARELVRLAEDAGLGNGCNPLSVVAGALYLAAREHDWPLTQAEIGRAANVTPTTMRVHYRELREITDESP